MSDLPAFSTSEEAAFKTCRLAHHFAYDLGYAPVVTNRKLSVGIGVHRGLEVYYRGGTREAVEDALAAFSEERWSELVAAGIEDDPVARVEFIKDRDLLPAMVFGYIEWVSVEGLDEGYETFSVEETALIDIPGAPCRLPVKMDLVQRHAATGTLRVVDFKTRASFYSDTTGYQLSEQNGNYSLAVMALYGERPTEFVYRELRKQAPTANSKPPYFREVRVRLTPEALVKRAEDYIATAKERFDPDRAIYANPGACCGSWKNDWQGPCLKVAEGMSHIEALETSSKYALRDPYARYDDPQEE